MSTPFQQKVSETFTALKHNAQREQWLPIIDKGVLIGNLRPLSTGSYSDDDIALLTQWRIDNQHWFPSQFNVTHEGTRIWLDNQVIGRQDRILFMIQDLHDTPIGHVGLSSFDYEEGSCEMDNVIRGRDDILPNGMVLAYKILAEWAMQELGAQRVFARLFADNRHSMFLQLATGFRLHRKIPMAKTSSGESIQWTEIPEGSEVAAERYFMVVVRSRATQS